MCGIAGILHLQNTETASGDAIRSMTRAMQHRGPDAEGIYAEGNVFLGHRRLSIIDLSDRSNQPMFDPERRYAIVFNGEVYNYQEVRSRIKQYPFQTGGDTEVVLAAFKEWGWRCLEQLKGMFAFAIWDSRESKLYLARDRMGVKPLYYYRDGEVFVFASEIRSILASGLVKRKISLPAIFDYLQYQSFQCPQTIVEDVWELKAGHHMEIGPGHFKNESYWSILNAPLQEHCSANETRSRLKELLLQSVARRMVADVPVAAFLSGGIDSTAVVALMAELAASVETFNVSFRDTEFDESKYAQMVSAKFGTRHHTIITSPEKFLDEFPNALYAMDSPSGDGINTYIVAKAVRSMGIKVALSGIGADELFAGYPIFHHWTKIRKNGAFWKIPYGFRKALSTLAAGNNIRNQRISGLLRMQTPSIENVYTLLRQVNSKQSIHRLMMQLPERSQLSDNLVAMQPGIGQFPLLSQLSIAEFSGYTRQTLLRDTDQMSMSQSLEVREPFFDHELVEFVLGLPDRFKTGDKPKPLLLDTLGSSIPREIYDRPKKGFVLPFENWFRNELRSFCSDKINDLSQRGFFKEKQLHDYWDDFLHQRNTVRWTNIMLLVSLEHYLNAHGLEL